MKNIKLSFEHRNYIYPFRLSLNSPNSSHYLEQVNLKHTEDNFNTILKEIIVTREEMSVINSLSLGLKCEFINEHKKKLQERIKEDYLGNSIQDHHKSFVKRSTQANFILWLELRNYILRILSTLVKESDNAESLQKHFCVDKWVALIIEQYHSYWSFFSERKQKNSKQQIEHYIVGLLVLEIIEKLVTVDVNDRKMVRSVLPQIQMIIVTLFNRIEQSSFKEQILIQVISLCKSLITSLKKQVETKADLQKVEDLKKQNYKKQDNSIISWIISLNQEMNVSHTVFELILKSLVKSANMSVIDESLSLLDTLFEEAANFGQVLFLITEAIRYDFPDILEQLKTKIEQRQYKSNSSIRCFLQYDLFELYGKNKIEPFKLKEMIKPSKTNEKVFMSNTKSLYKSILASIEKFKKFKMGKIAYKKKKKTHALANVQAYEIEQREIENMQKLIEQNHLKNKIYDMQAIQLYQQNEELIKVNRWYEQQIKQKENIIAELININAKESLRGKLSHQRSVLNYHIHLSVTPFKRKGSENNIFIDIKTTHKKEKEIDQSQSNGLQKSGKKGKQVESNSHFKSSLSKEELAASSETFLEASQKLQKNAEESMMRKSFNMIPPALPSDFNLSTSNFLILPPPPPPPPNNLNTSEFLLPPPPPPPPPPLLSLPLLSIQKKVQNNNPDNGLDLKMIGWNVIEPGQLKSTFWQSLSYSLKFDENQVIKNFSKKETKYIQPKSNTVEVKSVLKPERLKNLEIILKKLKINQKNFDIINYLLTTYDENYINQDFMLGLLNVMPNPKEKDIYLALPSFDENENWSMVDRFLHFISTINHYQDKIHSILFKLEYEELSNQMFQKMNDFISFFKQLKNDLFFHQFLSLFLSIGNFLNCNSARANAKAFRIQNIQKSYSLMSQDRETSLFEFVLSVLYQQNASIFEYQLLEQKSKLIVSLPVIKEDYKYFETKLNVVHECILISENNDDDKSSDYFLSFYIKAKQEVYCMKKQLDQANQIFRDTKQFYGDKMDSEEMARFIIDFRTRVVTWKNKKNRARK